MNQASSNLYFTDTHEWILTENNEATIGITDHAQESLGDIVFIEFPEIGTEVQAGEEIGVIESVKAAADFYAPVSGTVIAVNEAARDTPSLVNSAPNDDGWLIKIELTNHKELEEYLSEAEYKKNIDED